ncbi:nucleotidyltransferase domain-containing protein [Clostridium sp. CS001]|uniref:nucleotidyltransferase family protein n=1 Tax=Clostridium sp. CS001 TaxID=2880648 RepID=UPI001CF123E1|nr:nucleotidyltransferase domain-containing protein [Clostridium sp. CS001]MCB2289155.1 nucleotidyltransferase domain-containing protein [Clostridium sp. CS001]
MFNEAYTDDLKTKEELLEIITCAEFKNIFLSNKISNVIIFGSFTNDDFNSESDIDIAIIGEDKISFSKELELTQVLEGKLQRNVDLIDINDENVSNVIKIAALNSKFIIIRDKLLDEATDFYDRLYKENEEFWYILDREVIGFE